jgi:hypothetical protein
LNLTPRLPQIYGAVLVLLTQTLTMHHNLLCKQTLTRTNDILAAWSGIGSAVLQLLHQKTVNASTFGVLLTIAYLANILGLHISTPALVSVETINATRIIRVPTKGLPEFNSSALDQYATAYGNGTRDL